MSLSLLICSLSAGSSWDSSLVLLCSNPSSVRIIAPSPGPPLPFAYEFSKQLLLLSASISLFRSQQSRKKTSNTIPCLSWCCPGVVFCGHFRNGLLLLSVWFTCSLLVTASLTVRFKPRSLEIGFFASQRLLQHRFHVTRYHLWSFCICAPHSEDLLSAAEETTWYKWNKYIFVVQFISMMYNHGQSTNNVLPLSGKVLMETESRSFTPKLCVKYKIWL